MKRIIEADYFLLSVGYEERLFDELDNFQEMCKEEETGIIIHGISDKYENTMVFRTKDSSILPKLDCGGILIGLKNDKKLNFSDANTFLNFIIDHRHCACLTHEFCKAEIVEIDEKTIIILTYDTESG